MANTQFQNVWDATKQAALTRAEELELYRQRLLANSNIESGDWVEMSEEAYLALGADARDDVLYLITAAE